MKLAQPRLLPEHLQDAGCSQETIRQYFRLAEAATPKSSCGCCTGTERRCWTASTRIRSRLIVWII